MVYIVNKNLWYILGKPPYGWSRHNEQFRLLFAFSNVSFSLSKEIFPALASMLDSAETVTCNEHGLIWAKYLCKSSKQQTKINSKLKMLPKH